jgi:hypothetical protein
MSRYPKWSLGGLSINILNPFLILIMRVIYPAYLILDLTYNNNNNNNVLWYRYLGWRGQHYSFKCRRSRDRVSVILRFL